MAKSEFIGIALSGDELKIARLRVDKKRLQLVSAETIKLVTPLISSPVHNNEDDEGDEPEDTSAIFGLDDDNGNEVNLDEALSGDDDGFDMTQESTEDQGGGNNELLLEAVLNDIDPKKVNIGLNIPYGNTIFQFLSDIDYTVLKEKERKVIIEEKLNSIYDQPISSDNYVYQVRDDNSLLLASFENDLPLLNLIDQTATYYKGNIVIREIHADESALVGLIRANYNLEDDEYTVIVHIGTNSSRVVFLKGTIIYMVLPIINQGSKSTRILNTLFSKILFEIDKGDLPNVDRIIVTDHGGLGNKARDFFRKQLKDVTIENLQFHPDKFTNPVDQDNDNNEIPSVLGEVDSVNEDSQDLASYSTAIGLAWSASGFDSMAFPKLSFIPGYVLERQRVLKLEWHGILLLMLIAVIPFITNHFYQENASKIQVLENENRLLTSRIDEIRPIATLTDQLMVQSGQLNEQLELYTTLSENSYKWSATLEILNNGLLSVRSTWITQLRSTDEGMIIEGYSLYRNRIPRLANVFERATVQSVTEGEMRETKIYRFVILVDEITKVEEFHPKNAVPPANITDMINVDLLNTVSQ
ncbi:MAG: hypothetical protein WD267_06235 [Balneolales bacterium]